MYTAIKSMNEGESRIKRLLVDKHTIMKNL